MRIGIGLPNPILERELGVAKDVASALPIELRAPYARGGTRTRDLWCEEVALACAPLRPYP